MRTNKIKPLLFEKATKAMSKFNLAESMEIMPGARLWMIEPSFPLQEYQAMATNTINLARLHDDDEDERARRNQNGVAVIPINGPITKGFSWFGTSSIRIRNEIREAVANDLVHAILLHIDSPGGTVAGTQDLANEVRMADEIKPVFAHIDDLGASAAFWIASQTRGITANMTAEIGSIGTIAVVVDSSKAAEEAGFEVHVISTGEFKGAFTDGVPIPEEHLANLQERIDNLNKPFLEDVSRGRKMSMQDVIKIADGRVHIAAKAKALGLIDAVQSFEETLLGIQEMDGRRSNNNARKADVLIRLAENSS